MQRWNLNNSNQSLIVASIKIDYLQQVSHPSTLLIASDITRLGNTSFDLTSHLFHQVSEQHLATATTTLVCFNYTCGKTTPIYPQIKKDLLK